MAPGDSGKKVSRAARAGGKVRSAQSRSLLFPGFIAGVVILGMLGIVVSLDDNDASGEPPSTDDHWHAAYGVYLCDQFQPPLSDEDPQGVHHLHTHGDGLIHIHPAANAFTGEGADLKAFADTVGMDISDDSIDLPGDLPDVSEGDDDCDGDDAIVQMAVWEPTEFNQAGLATGWEDDPEIITEGFDDFRPQDDHLITIAFAPEGAEIPQPPSINGLAAPVDEQGGGLPPGVQLPDEGGAPTEAGTGEEGTDGATDEPEGGTDAPTTDDEPATTEAP